MNKADKSGRKSERKSEKEDTNYNAHLFWVSQLTIFFSICGNVRGNLYALN